MSETLLTKCPHCGTTFRLTQAQLQIASGAVRCGACYQVFHANEHFVKTAAVEEIRPARPAPGPAEEAAAAGNDDGLDPYDDTWLDLGAADGDSFHEDYDKTIEADSGLEDFGYDEPAASKSKKSKEADESWAEALLKELGGDLEEDDEQTPDDKNSHADNALSLDEGKGVSLLHKRKTGSDLSDTFRTLGDFSDDPFAISELEGEDFKHGDTHDESWAKAMLDELEETEAPPKPPETLSILDDEPGDSAVNPYAARELARSRREAVERARAEERSKPKAPKKAAAPDTGDGLRNTETEEFFRLLEDPFIPPAGADAPTEPNFELDGLAELDDLEEDLKESATPPEKPFADANDLVDQQIRISDLRFTENEPERHTGRNILLALGTLLLILVGAGQYVWFNLDTLSRNPQWRPLLEQACEHLGCQLPGQVSLRAITSTNLVVRSHPTQPNALVVDVIIKNKATFEQPFPALQLNFEDINGNPVASGTFQPREYIRDAAVDIQRMPPDVPIHLNLELVDPGKNAVNYHIQFLPAATSH